MELIKLLPDYYEKNIHMNLLQNMLSQQAVLLEGQLTDAVDQCFIETATDALSRYERILGLKTDRSKTEEYRRERIKAKMVSMGTTTKAVVAFIAACYTGAEVEITEKFPEYTIIVSLIENEGTIKGIQDIEKALLEVLPAHLHLIFCMIYRNVVRQQILYKASVTFTMAFHPRLNLSVLYLNGTWLLDGKRILNGYDSSEQIDLYPAQVKIRSAAAAGIEETVCIRLSGKAGGIPETSERFQAGGCAAQDTALAGQFKVSSGAEQKHAVGEIIIHNMNILNGSWSLDADRTLNGGRCIL